MTRRTLACLLVASGAAASSAHGRTEAFEVTQATFDQLPRGKEADGIIGDFILRSDAVEAVVSGNAWDRRANMSTFYGDGGVTPGCLYDLTPRGAGNDQITIFSPGSQKGPVSWVRVLKDGAEGEAAVETVTTAAAGNGIFKRHVYAVRDGLSGVLVTTTWRNETGKLTTLLVEDRWTGVGEGGASGGIRWAGPVDPADGGGYAVRDVSGSVTLQPGEEKSIERLLVADGSPAGALGLATQWHGDKPDAVKVLALSLRVTDAAGKPVPKAAVHVPWEGAPRVPAWADAAGLVSVLMPATGGEISVEHAGRAPVRLALTQEDLSPAEPRVVALGVQTAIRFHITDTEGVSVPCKVNFTPLTPEGAPLPPAEAKKALNLGPQNRARGCVDQWHSETGQFRVPLPPGRYRVNVTRGIEFGLLSRDVTLQPGDDFLLQGELKRLVDTRGWISADFHNHSTPSGDNTCGTDDRVINLAAEHVEFAPTTEHNRFYDWEPHIARLGLQPFLKTIPGVELTGSTEHVNSFPFTPEPGKQDAGAPKWNADPRITALTARHWQKKEPDRWVQVNHPNLEQCFVDVDRDGVADGGYVGIGQYVDGWEIENSFDTFVYPRDTVLGDAPYSLEVVAGSGMVKRVRYQREIIWLQLLNQGHRLRAVAVCDAHSVYGNGVGTWRTYLPSTTDDPAKVDWREMSRAAKAGRSYLTTGPFMTVVARSNAGECGPGDDLASADGALTLRVRVLCTDWLDVDRVQVLVNGRAVPEANFTRASHPDWFGAGTVKFDREFPVKLAADAHVIVVAVGENSSLVACYGTSPQGVMRPMAYNNPFYVDLGGDGWKPNRDTLGHELPVSNLTADKVRTLLGLPEGAK